MNLQDSIKNDVCVELAAKSTQLGKPHTTQLPLCAQFLSAIPKRNPLLVAIYRGLWAF
jgi:hypothetical protein